jgi:transposase
MIAPDQSTRARKTQDGRKLRRYRRRRRVERRFAWLQQFRCLVTRYAHRAKTFFAFAKLACIVMLLRSL